MDIDCAPDCDCGTCDGCASGFILGSMCGPDDCKNNSGCLPFVMFVLVAAFFVVGIVKCNETVSPANKIVEKFEEKTKKDAKEHTGTIVDIYWTLRFFGEDSTTVVEDSNKRRYLLKGKRGKKGEEISFLEGETIK